MRIKTKEKARYKDGDELICSGFLFLPKKISNEWRWLERASWRQQAISVSALDPDVLTDMEFLDWVCIEWVDD